MFFLAFLLLVQPVISQSLLKEVPPEHRLGVEALERLGFIDQNQPLTRYELAKALHFFLERVQLTEQLLSELSKPEVDDLEELVKEYRTELKNLGEDVNALEKLLEGVPSQKNFLKEEETFAKTTLQELKEELKKYEEKIEDLRGVQSKFLFSGNVSLKLSNKDFFQSGLARDRSFLSEEGCTPKASEIEGRSPGSCFDFTDDFSLQFKVNPSFIGSTSRQLSLGAKVEFPSRNLGSITSNPGGTRTTLSLSYSAPGQKFIRLEGGQVGASSGFIALSSTAFGGFKSSFIFSHKKTGRITAEVFGGQINRPSSDAFGEKLRGFSLNTTFKGANQFNVSFFEDELDGDSRVVDEKEATTTKNLPDKTSVLSSFTQFTLTNKIRFRVEYSISRFKQFDRAFLVEDTLSEDDEDNLITCPQGLTICRTEAGATLKRDTTLLGLVFFSDPPLSATNFFVQQNPNYRNRRGGAFGILSLFGGAGSAFSLGGIDLSSLLNGGIRLMGTFTQCTAPNIPIRNPGSLLKRLFCNPLGIKNYSQNIVLATGSEVQPTKLSELVENLGGDQVPQDIIKNIGDIDKRKNKLNIFLTFPMLSWRPTPRTSIKFSTLYAKFEIPPETVVGNRGANMASLQMSSVNDTNLGGSPEDVVAFFQSQNCNNVTPGTFDFFILQPYTTKAGEERVLLLHFDKDPAREYAATYSKSPDGSCALLSKEFVHLSSGEPFAVRDITNGDLGSIVTGDPSLSEFCRSATAGALEDAVTYPCEGNFALNPEIDPGGIFAGDVVQNPRFVTRMTRKQIIFSGEVFQPKLEVTHRFSNRLNYSFSWEQFQLKLKLVFFDINLDTLKKSISALQSALPPPSTTISHSLSYQIFRNLSASLNYSQKINNYGLLGHKERTENVDFTLKLDF